MDFVINYIEVVGKIIYHEIMTIIIYTKTKGC